MSEKLQKTIAELGMYTKIGFAITLAKDVGILEVLLSADQPLTSHQIADEKQLKERYVREMLGSLCSVEYVQVNSEETGPNTYYISPENKELIKNSLVGFTMNRAVMEAYKPVRDCVYLSGPKGVKYGDELFRTLDEKNIATADHVINFLLESVPELKARLEQGIQVAEFGTGLGRLLSRLATMFPNSTFTASEYRTDLVDRMRELWKDIPNMRFDVTDLCAIPETAQPQYDLIYTVDVIHDLPHPLTALKGLRRLIKEPDGLFLNLDMAGTGSHKADVGSIEAACLYSLSTFLCIPESFQQEDSAAYGACWAESTAISLKNQAGFEVKLQKHGHDREGLYICRPKIEGQ